MYRADVYLAYGSGGLISCYHRYWAGTGVAMCRSPKRAVEIATRLADKACGEGTAYTPVLSVVTIEKVR